jgi:hypothetical protein
MGYTTRILFIKSFQLFLEFKLLYLIDIIKADNRILCITILKIFNLNCNINICSYYFESMRRKFIIFLIIYQFFFQNIFYRFYQRYVFIYIIILYYFKFIKLMILFILSKNFPFFYSQNCIFYHFYVNYRF